MNLIKENNVYKMLFDEFQEALLIVYNNSVIKCNKKALKLYEYTENELIGKSIKDIETDVFDANMRKECEISSIKYHINHNGDIFPVEVSIKNIEFDEKLCELYMVRNISKCVYTHKYIERLLNYKDALVVCSKILLKNGDFNKTLQGVLNQVIKLTDFSRIYLFENFVQNGEIYARLVIDECRLNEYYKKDDPEVYCFKYSQTPITRLFLSAPSPVQYKISNLRSSPQDLKVMEKYGIKSILLIPIYVSEKLYGFMGFDDCEKEVVYDDITVDMIQLLGKLIGFYIAKKIYEEHLQTSREVLEGMVEDRTIELSQKNSELEGFMYSMTHEIQSPLANIDMLLHTIEPSELQEFKEDIKDYFFKTHIEVHHIMGIINSLLTLFRISKDRIKIQECNLGELLWGIYSNSYKRKSDLLINFTIQKNLECNGDINLLVILLENLLSNSIKYRQINKVLNISLTSEVDKGHTTYCFSDNGIGFDMKKSADLFKPFYRVHEKSYPGNGIGLSIVKKIIMVHGGDIRVESEQNKGTSFYFTLT